MKSLGLFVGTGECNANCSHCAGKEHRKYAPKKDGMIPKELFRKTLRECHANGARYLSISSSGEPTLSPEAVTETLWMVYNLRNEGIKFSPINLYTNGIRIGEDYRFASDYLHNWRGFGLENIYLTVHHPDENKNAKAFGIRKYPSLEKVIERIHGANLSVRANMMLSKNTVYFSEDFASSAERLFALGADRISAWPIRNADDEIDKELAPSEEEFARMKDWIERNGYNKKIKLIYNNSEPYLSGDKLTLFPDGTLSGTWCRH